MGGPAFGRTRAIDAGVKVIDHGQADGGQGHPVGPAAVPRRRRRPSAARFRPARQGAQLTRLVRWYTPGEVLTDLLLVDNNPVEDISLVENPDRNVVVIMKDGQIFRNLLPQPAP
jgi:hypothetical protein